MPDPITILVVDDNEANRNVLGDLIISIGYRFTLAENGLSALAQIGQDPPDLVLLDLLMPIMDGYAMLEKMKDRGLLRDIPVIMVSAVDDINSTVRCLKLGADDYMIKPFNHTLLKARIDSSLEKKRLRDREEEFRQLVEEYNLSLEARVRDQVNKIMAVELERANLGRYLSPAVVQSVLNSEREVDLGGKKTDVTVLFSDIRGYTRLAQELQVQEVMQLLNEHFTDMSRIIFEHEGTLDKFIGDSVMAVFGSPFSSSNDAGNAVLAAQEMQRAMAHWHTERNAPPSPRTTWPSNDRPTPTGATTTCTETSCGTWESTSVSCGPSKSWPPIAPRTDATSSSSAPLPFTFPARLGLHSTRSRSNDRGTSERTLDEMTD